MKRTIGCDSCNNVIVSQYSKKVISNFAPPNLKRLEISKLVATTLTRTIFLVKILISPPQQTNTSNNGRLSNSHLLALELSLQMMRNSRGPAATKSLEVMFYYLVCFITLFKYISFNLNVN